MDLVSSPVELEHSQPNSSQQQHQQQAPSSHPSALVPSHGISIDVEPPTNTEAVRPRIISHLSTPAYESPLRHHRRTPSAPRKVKESLNARSEYVTSQDDGSAQHRINQYIIKQEIGRGSFGAVHLAVDHTGEEYAVKEFSKSRLRKRAQSHILRTPRAQRQRGNLAAGDFNSPLHRNPVGESGAKSQATNAIDLIREEIAIMKKLNHPNLVSLIEVLDDPTQDSLYMVLEMCKKGVVMKVGLGETADPYSEEQCRCWFRDLILGIEYLHAQGILHRDIKPDNCLLTKEDVLKIVDFGVSEMFEKDSEMLTAKSAGSPAFLPPELCVVRHGGISGKAADIWSMGVTLYCLRYGKIPFERTAILDLYEAIKHEPLALHAGREDPFCDLMLKILEKDPEKRISMAELREHPWVTKNATDPLLSYEENTAELVDPPTDEEVNRAITSDMKHLITVMKAVHKFKALLAQKRPPVMKSILGDEDPHHLSQPPLSMDNAHANDAPPPRPRSSSVDMHDRRPVEGALVAEGVHREMGLGLPIRGGRLPSDRNLGADSTVLKVGNPALERGHALAAVDSPPSPIAEDASRTTTPTSDREAFPPFSRTDLLLPIEPVKKAQTVDNVGHRGHAHDPLEDHLYLYIGPSTFAGVSQDQDQPGNFMPEEDDDDGLIVSESPGAADIDIYETAYRDEIERIRARLLEEGKDEEEPEVYLTRRVDAKLMALGGLAGRMMAYGEEGLDRVREIRSLKEGRARVGGISRALRAAAKEEYERRKAERRARETVETAKAEMHKSHPVEEKRPERKEDRGTVPPGEEQESVQRQDIQPISNRTQSSLFSGMSGRAWDRGRQAKSSFKELYGKAREFGARQSSGNT